MFVQSPCFMECRHTPLGNTFLPDDEVSGARKRCHSTGRSCFLSSDIASSITDEVKDFRVPPLVACSVRSQFPPPPPRSPPKLKIAAEKGSTNHAQKPVLALFDALWSSDCSTADASDSDTSLLSENFSQDGFSQDCFSQDCNGGSLIENGFFTPMMEVPPAYFIAAHPMLDECAFASPYSLTEFESLQWCW